MVRLILFLGVVAVAGCDQRRCADMTLSDAGLVLTIDEHPTGWAEPECGACHLRAALHRRACTPDVDMQAVRDQVAADPTSDVCAACHGDNGVLE